jgi:hypothetical protein
VLSTGQQHRRLTPAELRLTIWFASTRALKADHREVDPPIEMEAATWSKAGHLDWWVKNGGNGGVACAVQTAVNGGLELLIFVLRAAHRDDLSLSFVAGRRASLPNRRLQDGGVLDLRAAEHRDWVEANAATSPGFVAQTAAVWPCPFCGRTGQMVQGARLASGGCKSTRQPEGS